MSHARKTRTRSSATTAALPQHQRDRLRAYREQCDAITSKVRSGDIPTAAELNIVHSCLRLCHDIQRRRPIGDWHDPRWDDVATAGVAAEHAVIALAAAYSFDSTRLMTNARFAWAELWERVAQKISTPPATGEPKGNCEPLTPIEQAVYDLIRGQGPITAKGILAALDKKGMCIDDGNLRSRIIPRLKRDHGVENRRNAGYYLPK